MLICRLVSSQLSHLHFPLKARAADLQRLRDRRALVLALVEVGGEEVPVV